MPHLAPLKWLTLASLFWLLLLSCLTMTWWQNSPRLYTLSSSFLPLTPPKWPWH